MQLIRKNLIKYVIQDEISNHHELSIDEQHRLIEDLTIDMKTLLKKFVIIEDDRSYEKGFTPRSMRAQIKQNLPYMPNGLIDKMLLKAPKVSSDKSDRLFNNRMATS